MRYCPRNFCGKAQSYQSYTFYRERTKFIQMNGSIDSDTVLDNTPKTQCDTYDKAKCAARRSCSKKKSRVNLPIHQKRFQGGQLVSTQRDMLYHNLSELFTTGCFKLDSSLFIQSMVLPKIRAQHNSILLTFIRSMYDNGFILIVNNAFGDRCYARFIPIE